MTSRVKRISFHVLGWVLFFGLIIAFVSNFQDGRSLSGEFIFPFSLFALVFLSLFYLNERILLPKLYLQRKYILYFTITFALLIAVSILKPFDRLVMHSVDRSPDFPSPGKRSFPGGFHDRPSRQMKGRGPQFDIV